MKGFKIERCICGVIAAALTPSAGWASEPQKQPLDPAREHALSAPANQLAREMLAVVAPQLVEVERPTFTGALGRIAPLDGLSFATKARAAGDPGLCQATTVWVPNEIGPDDDPISTSTVYKVVGELKPLPDMWNAAYGAELSAKCAHAGRVIPSRSSGFGEERFFDAKIDGEVRVWFAARALELALDHVRTHPDEVSCDGSHPQNRQQCRAELLAEKTLKLERLLKVEMKHCDKGGSSCYAVTGTFLRDGFANVQNAWILSLRADIPDATASDDVKGVTEIELGSSGTIFD